MSLSIFDDLILRISNNDIENTLDDIHNLGENVLYMLSCEKTIKDEQQMAIESNLINDDEYSLDKYVFIYSTCNYI